MITSIRERILQEAERLTMGDRNRDYGDPVANHRDIARIFNRLNPRGIELDGDDIALVHIATKFSRMKQSEDKVDHYVDLCAYIGILAECRGLGEWKRAEEDPVEVVLSEWRVYEDPEWDRRLEKTESEDWTKKDRGDPSEMEKVPMYYQKPAASSQTLTGEKKNETLWNGAEDGDF